MVKGITKQVIVVHTPDPKLFEQAIFILKEDVAEKGITDEELLREAKAVIREDRLSPDKLLNFVWALVGASLTGLAWAISMLL